MQPYVALCGPMWSLQVLAGATLHIRMEPRGHKMVLVDAQEPVMPADNQEEIRRTREHESVLEQSPPRHCTLLGSLGAPGLVGTT